MANLELKMDVPVVSTKLAEDYMLQYKDEINEIKRYLTFTIDIKQDVTLTKKKLAKKIEENTQLFCQLEYLNRKKSIDEVKNIDLKLLVNCLLDNCEGSWNDQINALYTFILNSSYLTDLGQFEDESGNSLSKTVCTDRTAAVCHLFVKLLKEVGSVVTVNTSKAAPECFLKLPCAGVVTEKSDIDSAVDAFLISSKQYPWRLQRIFVQESVYDSFKKSVQHKSKLKKRENINATEDLTKLCTELHVYKDKIIMFDYVGVDDIVIDNDAHRIRVEAYRTTKELLVLTQNYKVLSLWSSDISEAHEIAVESPSVLVWINDFDNVDGPPMSSRWLSSILKYSESNVSYTLKLKLGEDIQKSLKWWSRIDAKKQRIATISKAIDLYNKNNASSDQLLANSMEKELLNFQGFNKNVEIENGRVYMNFDVPIGVTASEIKHSYDVPTVIRSLILGNIHLVTKTAGFGTLLDELKKVGVPITDTVAINDAEFELNKVFSKTKTIVSNFGTIFAN